MPRLHNERVLTIEALPETVFDAAIRLQLAPADPERLPSPTTEIPELHVGSQLPVASPATGGRICEVQAYERPSFLKLLGDTPHAWVIQTFSIEPAKDGSVVKVTVTSGQRGWVRLAMAVGNVFGHLTRWDSRQMDEGVQRLRTLAEAG